MELSRPFVSIVVVTYNSAPYIVETLNSFVVQTYENLEIIICDDCSTDETQKIIDSWIDKFEGQSKIPIHKFYSSKNLGITKNLQNGVLKANGEWVKTMAGDDLLISTAIEELVNFSITKNSKFSYSNIDFFPFENVDNSLLTYQQNAVYFGEANLSAEAQHKILKNFNFVFTPGVFFNKLAFDSIKGFDLDIPFLEDWPLYIKIAKNGYKIRFLNRKLVQYRIHNTSVQKSKKYSDSLNIFSFKYQYSSSVYMFLRKFVSVNIMSKYYQIFKFFFTFQISVFKIKQMFFFKSLKNIN